MVTANLRAEDGSILATAELGAPAEGAVLVVSRVTSGAGNLLTHYFGGGGRRVRVQVGEVAVEGILATRWLGSKRLWLVRLDAPAPSGVFEPVEARDEAICPAAAVRE